MDRPVTRLEDDDEPKKTPRATVIRRVLVGLLALACAGGWVYTRFLVKKNTLGEACSFDMHCRSEAPRCLKQSVDEDGVCSRPCDNDGDCAPDIKCVKVELDDRDDRGRPLEGGYCFPQAMLDARKKKKRDGGAAMASAASSSPLGAQKPPPSGKSESWIDIPDVAGQLDGTFTIEIRPSGRAMLLGGLAAYDVKGTLVRTTKKGGRSIVDTSTMRSYSVDDEKQTFSATQLAVLPGEVKITKTGKTDRVADHDCEIWNAEESNPQGKVKAEVCVVKGGAFVNPSEDKVSPLEKELAVRGVFPLRVREEEKVRFIVRKTADRPLDASAFTIPKTYKNLAAH
jgi:hypothetical protein